ncbi:hypothetical protein EC9_45770 [Rosistilla ulvae]|uniref:Uncharacterized protein n=1 Tax=Rosistilla ulvae TaxID=1930277 RepID=A0A517M665_9BACT|nr:hypothetical protein EC9_45770 [Rosistilla ulvae]
MFLTQRNRGGTRSPLSHTRVRGSATSAGSRHDVPSSPRIVASLAPIKQNLCQSLKERDPIAHSRPTGMLSLPMLARFPALGNRSTLQPRCRIEQLGSNGTDSPARRMAVTIDTTVPIPESPRRLVPGIPAAPSRIAVESRSGGVRWFGPPVPDRSRNRPASFWSTFFLG